MRVYSPWKNVDWLFVEWRQGKLRDQMAFPWNFTPLSGTLSGTWSELLILLMSTVVYPSHNAVDLLFKKGDRLQTKNWRPISLLNIDYKFATWTMAGRLLAVIASVVSPDQTCGVPRYTISEIFALFRDTIAYAEMENQPVAFLSLDQETGPYLKIRRQYNVNILYILKCELLIKGRNEKYQ